MKRGFALGKVIVVLVILNLLPVSVGGLLMLRQWWMEVSCTRLNAAPRESRALEYGTRRGRILYVVINENRQNPKEGVGRRVQHLSTGELRLHKDDGTWIELPSRTQVYRFSDGVMTEDPKRYTNDELQKMVNQWRKK